MELQTKKKQYDLETLIKHADIFYGSGGSQNAIFVYKHSVAKLIPNFKKRFNETEKYNNDQEEIKFYKEFTKNLVLKHKTPHIVGFYDNKKINMYSLLDKYIRNCSKRNTVWEQLYSTGKDEQDNYMQYPYEDYVKSQDKSNTIKPGLIESIVTFIKTLAPLTTKTKKTDTQSKYSTYTSKTKKATTTIKPISKEKENINDIICQYRKIGNEYINS